MKNLSSRNTYIGWIVLTAVGLCLGLSIGLAISAPIEVLVGMMLVTPVMLGFVGAVLGASQWFALQLSFPTGILWIAVTAVGMAVGMTSGVVLVEVIGQAILGEQPRLFSLPMLQQAAGLTLIGVITGISVGFAQWLVLRKLAEGMHKWILVSFIGFGLGLPVGAIISNLTIGGLAGIAGFSLFLIISGMLIGSITGIMLKKVKIPA